MIFTIEPQNVPNIGNLIEEVLKKYDYCSLGNSLLQDRLAMEDGIIPEQKYRNTLVNLHGCLSTLKQYHYDQKKLEIDIERKKLEIEALEENIRRVSAFLETEDDDFLKNKFYNEKPPDIYDKKRMELDLKKFQIELMEIEESKKLAFPLVKDAINKFNFFYSYATELEKTPFRPFEEATQNYHERKVLENVVGDILSKKTGIDKSTLEYAHRYGVNIGDTLAQLNLDKVLTAPRFSLKLPENILAEKSLPLLKQKKVLICIPKINDGTPLRHATDLRILQSVKDYQVEAEIVTDVSIPQAIDKALIKAQKENYDFLFIFAENIILPVEGITELLKFVDTNPVVIPIDKVNGTDRLNIILDTVESCIMLNIPLLKSILAPKSTDLLTYQDIRNNIFVSSFPLKIHEKLVYGKVDFSTKVISFNGLRGPLPNPGEQLDFSKFA